MGDRPRDLLLAEAGGRIAARAVVTTEAGLPNTALLGLYEARSGQEGDEATRDLLARAMEWSRRHGCRRLLAPVDGCSWLAYRFRVPGPGDREVPARRDFPWEPNHPPRYLERFLREGFHEAIEFETLGLIFPHDGPYRVVDAEAQTRPAAEAVTSAGYRFRLLREHRNALPWADLHRLCSDAFSESPLFAPISPDVFQALYGGALGPAARDFTHWIVDPEGVPCAVMFAFRDGDAVVIKSVAVHPAHRGRKLSTALVHRGLAAAAEQGVSELVSAMVRAGNTSEFLSRRHLMPGVTSWRRCYAVLARELDR
jgi:GNAT superfamily N-acetyltransferase